MLERIGFKGTVPASFEALPLSAHIEVHIEQGPILEAENLPIGVVTGVQGILLPNSCLLQMTYIPVSDVVDQCPPPRTQATLRDNSS